MQTSQTGLDNFLTSALCNLATNLGQGHQKTETLSPSEWIEKHFLIPDPRDPITGEELPAGPIRLAEHQKRVIDAALGRTEDGKFKYTTIVYSATKKSGKSALSSAVALWLAWHRDNAFVACLANDGKQANDRLYGPIYTNFRLHRQQSGMMKDVSPKLGEVILPNYSKIEAVPCDAAGEAGAQPLGTFFCFDDKTEILTRDGWKTHDTYSMSDKFVTLDAEGNLEYQKPVALHIHPYVGPMYELDTARVSVCVTPEHKLYGIFGRKSVFEKRPVEDAITLYHYGMRVESKGLPNPTYVPDVVHIEGTKRKDSFDIPIKEYLQLLGWYLAEGCTHKKEAVMVAQKNTSPYYIEIWQLIERLGYTPHVWAGTDAIIFYDVRLAKHFKQFGLAHEKFIPDWVKRLPREYVDILLTAYWKGDGYKTGAATLKNGNTLYATNSPALRDDLMELAVLQGRSVRCTSYQDKRWGRLMYTINVKLLKTGEKVIRSKKKFWKTISYDGVIHCPTVPNGIVIIRRNGKVQLQGQSELWGFDTPNKKRLFVEMTVPPTLYGYAIRWIESYAGYTGVSELLEQMYETGFLNGSPHPDFLDLVGVNGPVVRENKQAGMFVYWDTEPRMPWQTKDYYVKEAAILAPDEFKRIHRNQWVSPASSFVEKPWWEACRDDTLPELRSKKTPVVVGIDMAVTGDCAALVAVTRSPKDPGGGIAVRGVRVFKPSQVGGEIDQERLIRPVIEDWYKRWNVVCWVYDPREMAKLAQDMNRAGFGWFKPFSQTALRAIADKQLHDMIMQRQIVWGSSTEGDVVDPDTRVETLSKHIIHAGAVTRGDSYRLEKLSNSAHIDAAVALSQASYTAMRLALGNKEMDVEDLARQLQRREITLEEFSLRVRAMHPQLEREVIT